MFETKIEKSGIAAIGSVDVDESGNLFLEIKIGGDAVSDAFVTKVEAEVLRAYFESLAQ
jgi:hypothetical protein